MGGRHLVQPRDPPDRHAYPARRGVVKEALEHLGG